MKVKLLVWALIGPQESAPSKALLGPKTATNDYKSKIELNQLSRSVFFGFCHTQMIDFRLPYVTLGPVWGTVGVKKGKTGPE